MSYQHPYTDYSKDTPEVLFGLIGHPLSHSFSKTYFTNKFEHEGLHNHKYFNFDITSIELVPAILKEHPNLAGLNVTIPYKKEVIQYLDNIDPGAQNIGSVNTISICDGALTGYNTDVYGFEESLKNFLPETFQGQALILGTGGASLAVRHVLGKMKIPYKMVSRGTSLDGLTYEDILPEILKAYQLIVNTTPLGMRPDLLSAPPLPYHALESDHILFDLIYNPEKTLFLKYGENRGCRIKNGLQMLVLQAEKSWEIWNKDLKI